jgi:hypothetical protein
VGETEGSGYEGNEWRARDAREGEEIDDGRDRKGHRQGAERREKEGRRPATQEVPNPARVVDDEGHCGDARQDAVEPSLNVQLEKEGQRKDDHAPDAFD